MNIYSQISEWLEVNMMAISSGGQMLQIWMILSQLFDELWIQIPITLIPPEIKKNHLIKFKTRCQMRVKKAMISINIFLLYLHIFIHPIVGYLLRDKSNFSKNLKCLKEDMIWSSRLIIPDNCKFFTVIGKPITKTDKFNTFSLWNLKLRVSRCSILENASPNFSFGVILCRNNYINSILI